jgi:hypothetical protein
MRIYIMRGARVDNLYILNVSYEVPYPYKIETNSKR